MVWFFGDPAFTEFRARLISNSLLEALIDRGWPRGAYVHFKHSPATMSFLFDCRFPLNPRRPPSQVFSFRQYGGRQRCAPKLWLRRTLLNYTIFSNRTTRQVRSSSNHTCVSSPPRER